MKKSQTNNHTVIFSSYITQSYTSNTKGGVETQEQLVIVQDSDGKTKGKYEKRVDGKTTKKVALNNGNYKKVLKGITNNNMSK